MNKIEELKLKSNEDGLELAVTIFIPEGDIKGIVQFAHGMMEHRKRYYEFIDFLCSSGYICVINDHRGHGESVKSSNDYGYFYENGTISIVEDLHQVTLYMKEKYNELPYFMFGFSMGTLVARAYIKKYDSELDGLILCGPPSNNKGLRFGKLLTVILSKTRGDYYRSNFIHRIIFGKDFYWLCTDKNEVEKLTQDPSSGFTFTINGFDNLFNLVSESYDKNNWIKSNLDLPIYYIAGSEDIVIVNEKKFNEAIDFIRDIGYSDITSKLYKNKYHDLLHEDIKQEFFKDILTWIDKNNGK